MKNLSKVVPAFLCLLFTYTTVSSQISGTAFKDFNFNGSQEPTGFPTEPGAYGITVKAFNSANVQLGPTKTTAVNGSFNFSAVEIPAGTAVRIEFTSASGVFNAKNGIGNGTDVQFVTAPSATVNYAIASQDWYSNTANPYVATNGATNGDANTSGAGSPGVNDNLYIFPYTMRNAGNTAADDGGATRRRPNSELGAIFGMAFQKTTRTLFMSAYLKRHTGFGPNGIGAIYKSTVNATGVPAAASLLLNVSAIGINVGTDPRTVALPNLSITRNADVGVFSEIGKRGIGGIDVSEDGKDLYLVNMFEKKLHRINIGNPLKASFTAADVTGNWTITDPATGGLVWHPMACKTANGKVYIGGVVVRETSTTHNLAADTVGARGIVYEFDPATGIFTEVLRYALNYRRGFSNNDFRYPTKCTWWCGWQNNGNGGAGDPMQADYNAANGTFTGGVYYPQPMISSIEFDVDGSMILGIRDRFGDQMGYQNLSNDGLPTGTGFAGANNFYRGLTSGEVLRAGKNLAGVSFTLESRGQATNLGVTTGSLDADAPGNPAVSGNWSPVTSGTPWGGFFGPGWGGTAGTIPGGGPNPGLQGGYYYFNHNFTTTGTGTNGLGVATTLNGTAGAAINAHYVKSDGGVALLAGSNEVIHNLMDPVNTSFANGVCRLINTGVNAGTMSQRLDLVVTATGTPGNPTNSGKSNGLGDIEILTDYQPIEIGNRLWTDANGNGVQDAGAAEAGINGITIQLVSPGPNGIFGDGDDVVVSTAITATINGQSGSYFFSTLTVADARKPASFTGVGANDILPGFNYQVRIPNATGGSQQAGLAGLQLTRSNTAANAFDNIDNDATLSGTSAVIDFNTSNSGHNFDIGFKPFATLGDKAWRDDDQDGLQDAGEPGLAGITATLFNNAGLVVGTTVTDAYGFYLFDNLTAGTYQVSFTAPANYNFTIQTNNTDNTVLTGGSTATNGSDINAVTGRTANIVLTAGENERNIDAGLIFSQPANNSIGDRVWLDSDGNGNQNGTEPGISGVTVTLYAADGITIVATTVTDANGNYLFTGLAAVTNYIVGLTLPAGMTYTSTAGTTTGNATINSDLSAVTGKTTLINTGAAGNQITGIDAGLILTNNATASVGDKVWIDLPGGTTHVQDIGEPGLRGVTVNLYRDANADGLINGAEASTPYATTLTDAFGNYIFNNLPALVFPGAVYQVRFVLPVGYTFVTINIGADDFRNSDADATGLTKLYRISNGQRNLSIDAGVTQNSPAGTARFGDRVWFDANSNGTQDAGESGVAGVTVTLYNNVGIAIANATTDANGYYQFINLAAGTYSVGFSNLQSGYSFTGSTGTTSADPTTNSDVNPGTGRTTSFAILAGQSLQGLDCGLTAGLASGLGSMGNKVWYDLPGGTTGVQDAGELGVAGLIVTLLDAGVDGIVGNGDDGISRTTTTNALGEYILTGLIAGNYAVQFSNLPGSYTVTTVNAGVDDVLDSDGGAIGTGGAPAGASRTGVYNLGAGEENLTIDLGLIPPANTNTLGNYVWFDKNNDGIQDATEQGLAGVMVTLYNNAGTAIAFTTTNVNGEYLFTGLADGNYSTGFTNLPSGFDLTLQSITNTVNGSDADRISGRTATVTLNVGNRNDRTLDAGLISSRAALGNYVWMDSNGDGIQTAGETAVPGVTVTIFRPGFGPDDIAGNGDDALPVASMITDQNGQYLFENLLPGTYQVTFTTIPTGIIFTQQDAGGNDNLDSDVNPATGSTANVVLAAGDINLTVDAALFKPRAVIGNYIWADNNNGVQDATESGFAGVLVTLFTGATPVATAVSDANGGYLFPNVAPGTYSIIFTNLPTGVTFTVPDAGGNDNIDSDVLGTSITGIVVTTTTVNLSFDAGLNNAITLATKIEFTAFKKNAIAELNWKMGTDVHEVREFVIERSANGSSFTAISTVSADNRTTYLQKDLQPNNGINYYRIKIIYLSGAIKYSDVRILIFNGKGNIIVFPNPATEIINVQLPDSWQGKSVTIDLINQAGQVVNTKLTKQASQVESISVNHLAAGIYLLRIQDGDGNVEIRKLKVN